MEYNIDKNIPLPLYYQLKQIIIQLIKDGVYGENEAIPTEYSFIDKYDISRTTVRQALNELVSEGYLYRKKGVGTFVSSYMKLHDIQQDVVNSTIYKLDRVINRNGYVCKTKFLKAGIVDAPFDVKTHLGIKDNEEVWFMDRIRYAGTKPAAFSRSYIIKKFVDNFDKEAKKASQHLYQYLDGKGVKISLVHEKLIPGWPSNEIQGFLELDSRKPVMIIEDLGCLKDGTIVEYTVSVLDVTFIDMSATFKRE